MGLKPRNGKPETLNFVHLSARSAPLREIMSFDRPAGIPGSGPLWTPVFLTKSTPIQWPAVRSSKKHSGRPIGIRERCGWPGGTPGEAKTRSIPPYPETGARRSPREALIPSWRRSPEKARSDVPGSAESPQEIHKFPAAIQFLPKTKSSLFPGWEKSSVLI
jgi:hypothetical protein